MAYILLAVGLLFLAAQMATAKTDQNIQNARGNTNVILRSISTLLGGGAVLAMCGIIGYVIYLILTYWPRIIENTVSPDANTFFHLFFLLTLIQIGILYWGTSKPEYAATSSLEATTTALLYLIESFSLVAALSLGCILQSYTTDG